MIEGAHEALAIEKEKGDDEKLIVVESAVSILMRLL